MNNMIEKLVKDGREGRRTQIHLTITIIGSFLMVLGLVCFIIKANSVEYVDANGSCMKISTCSQSATC